MYKKLTILLVLLVFIFSAMPVYAANSNNAYVMDYNHANVVNNSHAYAGFFSRIFAAKCSQTDVQSPVIYKSDIVVTEAGGVYQVGFTTIKIPQGFIDADKLPIVLHVEISSVDGTAGIEFTPDIPSFNADVTINVHSYNGLLYDKTLGKNVQQRIKQQTLKVQHFSRYAFS